MENTKQVARRRETALQGASEYRFKIGDIASTGAG